MEASDWLTIVCTMGSAEWSGEQAKRLQDTIDAYGV